MTMASSPSLAAGASNAMCVEVVGRVSGEAP